MNIKLNGKISNNFRKKVFGTAKAQLSAFIVVAVVVLIIIWVSITYSGVLSGKKSSIGSEIENQLVLESSAIKENIDSCVRTLTDKGVQLLGRQGFYLNIPFDYKYNKDYAHWIIDTINIMPDDLSLIEEDLAKYVNKNLLDCVALSEFRDAAWSFSNFESSTTAKIFETDIQVYINYSLKVNKENFMREFTSSIYSPEIRFRKMYEKSIDLVNNQLLRPDLDFKNPLDRYDAEEYGMSFIELNKETLLFTIIDDKSKLLDGTSFNLTFVASFRANKIPRTYDVKDEFSSRVLYSPDRLAMLVLAPLVNSSSDNITISQYSLPEVIRRNTPSKKEGFAITQTKDITFSTPYPIYRFAPNGNNIDPYAFFRIYLNKDQIGSPDDFTLLYNRDNGWKPYPHIINSSGGFLDTYINKFSDYTIANCSAMIRQFYPGPEAEETRGFVETNFGPLLMVAGLALMGPFPGAGIAFLSGGIGATINDVLELEGFPKILVTYGFSNIKGVVAGLILDELFATKIDAENTLGFEAICDDTISIIADGDGGDCECYVTDLVSGSQTEVDGPYFAAKGASFALTAVVTGFDFLSDKATCECSVEGLVVSEDGEAYSENYTDMNQISGSLVYDVVKDELACCYSIDEYCLENYLVSKCSGSLIAKTCKEDKKCGKYLNAKGITSITKYGEKVTSGFSDTEFLISYYLPDASLSVKVSANIYVNSKATGSIMLYNDGSNGKLYKNTWSSQGVLEGETRAKVTFDIVIEEVNAQQVIIYDAGSLLIIKDDSECKSIDQYFFSTSIDITLASNYYGNKNEFNYDSNLVQSKLLFTNPIMAKYSEKKINFYQIDKLFATEDINTIESFSNTNCDFGDARTQYVLILYKGTSCTQIGNAIFVDPGFTFDNSVNENSAETVMNNFCGFVKT